VRTAVAELTC